MRTLLTTLLISTLVLSACGRDSRMNPRNWFGQSKPERVVRTADPNAANPLIPEQRDSIFRKRPDSETYEGTPIEAIRDVRVERSSGGAIITATGVSLRQGAFDVRLRPVSDDEPVNGVLSYTMDAVQLANTPQGPEQTRTVEAARFISTQTLEEIRTIRVIGATNIHTTSR